MTNELPVVPSGFFAAAQLFWNLLKKSSAEELARTATSVTVPN